MENRKFARGQKRTEASNIMQEEGENNRLDAIRAVPPSTLVKRFDEAGLIITDSDIALGKCQRQETGQLVGSIKEDGVRQWYRMRLLDLPVKPDMFAKEMAKGDSRYVHSEDVRARPTLRRQTELTYAKRVQSGIERWKVEVGDDPEKVALLSEAQDILRQAYEKGKPRQTKLDLFSWNGGEKDASN